ncbi:MAG TPA: MBL fold metallo-hydrolase [Hyphomicrobiaceae bacterium]|nr:MBL fold metallo-hydrolase [Hyphomicrobiaceae bacterium]
MSKPDASGGLLKAAVVPVTPFQQNCTLIWNHGTKVGVVIDPGGDLDIIEDAIRQVGMTVEKIILTHGHIDHAGGADELRAKLKVKIEGPHKADKFLLDGLAEQAKRFGVDSVRPVTPDRWLDEGDSVTIGGETFEIFHCPGHSPGSVVFFHRRQRLALVGDVLFRGSIGRTDFPYGDHDALISAIKTKLLPLGDDVAFICGHGPTSSFGRERETNPFIQ